MSKTLNEEKILIPEKTVDICIEAKRIEDTNGTEKDSSEKESGIVAHETKEEEETQITVKNIQKDNPVKDAKTEVEEEESIMTEKADLNEKDDAEKTKNAAKEVQPIVVEEIFKEENVEPVESLKDISDNLNAAAKSVIQKVAEKIEEKIEKSVEKEERKGVQGLPSPRVTELEDTFKEEKTKPVESNSDEKVDVSNKEEKVKSIESNSDEKVDFAKEEAKEEPIEPDSDEKINVSKEEEKTKPVESKSDEKVNSLKEKEKPVESNSDEMVNVLKEEEKLNPVESDSDAMVEVTKEEEIKKEVQEVQDLSLDSKDDMEIESKTTQDAVDGNEKEEIIEPICTQKTVKPLGSPEKEPKPESLPIESSNENNLSGTTIENTSSDASEIPKQEKEEETQPSLISVECKDEQGNNSSEGVTPEEKESFADIAQKIPFADEISDEIIEEVGKAPIVHDDETKLVVENTVKQNEESKESSEEDTQLNINDSECSADVAQEAEAEAEPCTEEIQEPVEAIIDDVEVESVSDNIETGSEQSTTSDTNDTNEKKKNSVNRLLLGAILVALIALPIAIISLDLTSIGKGFLSLMSFLIPFLYPFLCDDVRLPQVVIVAVIFLVGRAKEIILRHFY